jgi:hypothetical protein
MVTKQEREIKTLQDLLFKKEREINDLIISQGASAHHPAEISSATQMNNEEMQKENARKLYNVPISPNKPQSPLLLKRTGQESLDDRPKKQKAVSNVPFPIHQKEPISKDKNTSCPLCNQKPHGLMVSFLVTISQSIT